ncbi:MAG: Crp/Fnr family transcriptional regulator [Bacteroidetes bacterium]|nr:Crp/Fnr family transcriptional regulator [Bacteroidota bacterium]
MKTDETIFHEFLNAFREVPPADFDIISQHMHARTIKSGDVLLEPGKTAKELFFVISGILKITSVSEKGKEVVQFFVKSNKFCTILYSFNGAVISNEGIATATDARVLAISRSQLLTLYQKIPYLKNMIDSITQKTLLDKIQARNVLMGEDATVRYHKFLTQHPDIMQQVQLSDIASYLGITQQSLSRIRRNIK